MWFSHVPNFPRIAFYSSGSKQWPRLGGQPGSVSVTLSLVMTALLTFSESTRLSGKRIPRSELASQSLPHPASKCQRTIRAGFRRIDVAMSSTTMTSLNGIVYHSSNQELKHLLLEEVAVKVLICDGSRRSIRASPRWHTDVSFLIDSLG